MAAPFRRLLGLTAEGEPLFEPRQAHSILLSAAGGGKTTSGCIPWLLSMLADHDRAILFVDSKSGEGAAQCADLCAAYGRKVAIIDDAAVLGVDNPHRVSLSPLGNVVAAAEHAPGELVFALDNAANAAIHEPPDDAKNAYFRDSPRSLIEFAARLVLKRTPHLLTPGAIWVMLADPPLLLRMAGVEAEEGDPALASLSRYVLDLAERNPEHWAQHLAAALKALRIYSADSVLHEAGLDATLTHADLLREHYVVFLVGPIQHMARLVPHYSFHLQSFLEAAYRGFPGKLDLILEEASNSPLKSLVSALTTVRGFGVACHFVAQSRSELIRAFGEKETATIEENCVVKQYLGMSSFEEAERLSKAMGEEQVIQHGLGYSSSGLTYSGNLSYGQEPVFSPERLMRLPPSEQILHVKGVGFIHARKIAQNQIAPYCHELADNPLEGGRLSPDPKITLPTGGRRR